MKEKEQQIKITCKWLNPMLVA